MLQGPETINTMSDKEANEARGMQHMMGFSDFGTYRRPDLEYLDRVIEHAAVRKAPE
jgi:hypothetical protein